MSRIMPHPRPKFIRELPNTQKMLSYKKTPKHGSHVFKTVLYIRSTLLTSLLKDQLKTKQSLRKSRVLLEYCQIKLELLRTKLS